MNPRCWLPSLLLTVLLGLGCGHKEGQSHDHAKNDAHGHGEETPSGASFRPGKGVLLTEETRRSLSVEIAEVTERRLPREVRFTAQVFGEKHRHPLDAQDHSGCDVHGSGFVSTNMAAPVRPGQPVQLFEGSNAVLAGVVLAVQPAPALGEAEIVLGVSNATGAFKPGEFVPARIRLPRDEPVTAIAQAALLRTAEGTFVYAVNGEAFYRTAVKTGTEADGWVEITDGLLSGDQVVTKPVQALWLIELRATKGGGHSH